MSTDLADLLAQAQDEVWALARDVPRPPDGQRMLHDGAATTAAAVAHRESARDVAASVNAALPAFAGAAARLLSVTEPPDPGRGQPGPATGTRAALASIQAPASAGETPAHPRLERATLLLGAAADLASSGIGPQERAIAQNRALTVVATAARLSAAVAADRYRGTQEPAATRLDVLARAASAQRRRVGLDDGTPLRPHAAPSPMSVAEALHQWAGVTRQTLSAPAPPSWAMANAAADLAIITSTAARMDPRPERAEAARALARAAAVSARSWSSDVSSPGGRSPQQRLASRQMNRALGEATRPGARPDPLIALEITRSLTQITRAAHDLAAAQDRAVATGQVYIAARAYGRPEEGVPTQVAHAARTGGWVRLPAHHPRARQITAAAREVAAAISPFQTAQAAPAPPQRAAAPAPAAPSPTRGLTP